MQPTVLWAQRDDFVWLTVDVPNADDIRVDLTSESLKFGCKADGKEYSFEMKFFKPIVKEESKFLKHRLIDFALKKQDEEEWPRLISESKKLAWIKVDWSKWQDSDAEDEAPGFDVSNMGGFGDMGFGAEMAGLGGMAGADFSAFQGGEDSDDDDELPELPEDDNAKPEPLIQEVNRAESS
jgi:cytosolic prostaglandin-E synthase